MENVNISFLREGEKIAVIVKSGDAVIDVFSHSEKEYIIKRLQNYISSAQHGLYLGNKLSAI